MQSDATDIYEQVLQKCSKDEQRQLKLYKGRWYQALKNSATDASAVHVEAKCKKSYEDLLESLYAKYFKSGKSFSSGTEAVDFLKSKDYKIGKSKFYNDMKTGLVKKVSGKFFEDDLLEYAKNNLQRNTIEGNESGLQEQILIEDLYLKRLKREREEFEKELQKERYVDKDDVRRMLAMRASVFKQDMISVVDDSVPELVKMVGGDPDRIPGAIKFLKEQVYETMRRYAEGKIYFDAKVVEEEVEAS